MDHTDLIFALILAYLAGVVTVLSAAAYFTEKDEQKQDLIDKHNREAMAVAKDNPSRTKVRYDR